MRKYGWVVEIDPNDREIDLCKRAVGMNRKIQNRLLEYIIEEEKKLPEGEYLPKRFSNLRQIYMDNRAEWFVDENGEEYWSEVHKEVGPEAARRLSVAFKNFFESCSGKRAGRRSGYPRFRKMGKADTTRYTTGFAQPKERSVQIPKIGWVPMKESVDWTGKKVSSLTLKTKAGRWFVSFVITEEDWEIPETKEPKRVVGIDLGLGERIATTSDAEIIVNERFFRKGQRKLKRLQQELSRKQYRSNNYQKALIAVQLQHKRIADRRKDYLHKFTTSLVNNQDVIVLEDLNVEGMKRGLYGKSASDAAMAEIRRQVNYKAAWTGTQVIPYPRFRRSTGVCSCGYQTDPLPPQVREWDCPECKAHHDRDLAAAYVLEDYGWTVLQTQAVESSCKTNSDSSDAATSMKQQDSEDVSNVLIS